MDKKELNIIMELMEQLQGEMEPSHEDFNERLGRKPVEVVKVESKPIDDEPEEYSDIQMEEDLSPEEKLKQRLLALRGK